jgi:hypothetical protein
MRRLSEGLAVRGVGVKGAGGELGMSDLRFVLEARPPSGSAWNLTASIRRAVMWSLLEDGDEEADLQSSGML